MNNSAIQLKNVSFAYPGVESLALKQVNLDIPLGSFYALLGPNGAGKTTLLRLLCGRFNDFQGHLDIAPEFVGANGFLDPSSYGVLLENPGIYPKLSIREYVEYFLGFYGLKCSGQKDALRKDRIEMLSKKLELPDLSTRLSALSLGNLQKVQILRAMAPQPSLLILDEPVANLDPISRDSVWSLISDWRKQEGGTAIVCSHVLAEMEQEASHFAIIDKGEVLRQGDVANIESSRDILLQLPEGVSESQVQSALLQAGLSQVKLKPSKNSLSELYRNTVQ